MFLTFEYLITLNNTKFLVASYARQMLVVRVLYSSGIEFHPDLLSQLLNCAMKIQSRRYNGKPRPVCRPGGSGGSNLNNYRHYSNGCELLSAGTLFRQHGTIVCLLQTIVHHHINNFSSLEHSLLASRLVFCFVFFSVCLFLLFVRVRKSNQTIFVIYQPRSCLRVLVVLLVSNHGGYKGYNENS